MQPPDDGVRVAVLGGIVAGTSAGGRLRPRGRAVGTAAAAARLGARVDLCLLADPALADDWGDRSGDAALQGATADLALPLTGEPVRVTVVRAGPDVLTREPVRGCLAAAEVVVAAPGAQETDLAVAVLRAGRSAGALTVLHPDLSCPQIVAAFGYADVVAVNLRDTDEVPRGRAPVEHLAGALLAYGPELVAASAGGWGTLFAWTDGQLWWPAPAAADRAEPGRVAEALTAGLVAALAEGQAHPDATRFAAATAALAARLPGTAEPFPSRRQVQRLLVQAWPGDAMPGGVPVPSPSRLG